MQNSLKILKRNFSLTNVPRHNTFEQRSLPGWRGWLADKLWSILHRMGATRLGIEQIETLTYSNIEQRSISDTISYAIDEVLYHSERGGSPSDYCIVLGGKDFAELMHTEPFHSGLLTIPAGEAFLETSSGYRAKLSGYPVHVVPWLEGHAILPKVLIEKEAQKKH